jgi:predicted dehydrogenase
LSLKELIMSVVRWGLLSTAHINRRLIPVMRETTRGKLIAVASRSQEKADQYAQEWKIPLTFGSYDEMLNSGEIDAVYISLPNHLHAEWAIKALHAGIHVLCEKPFATSLKDVDAMISASQESNCFLAEAFMYRHHPQTKLIGEWVTSGRLGDINLIRASFTFFIPEEERLPEKKDVRLIPEYDGGALWDIGVYPISISQFVMAGPPKWVFGCQWIGKTGVDEVFTGQMGFLDNQGKEVLGQISCSFNSPFHTYLEIFGTEGKLAVTRPFSRMEKGGQMLFTNEGGKTQKIKIPKKSLYLGEVEDLQNAILDGSTPLISLEETRNHIRTTLALYESARSGGVVHLE